MTKEEWFYTHPTDKTLGNIENLIRKYGPDCTLKEAKSKYLFYKESRGYICPKCHGNGYIIKEYNTYPSGLPDSGWVYKPGYDYSECSLCHGDGYTTQKYKPKTETKVIGYELDND